MNTHRYLRAFLAGVFVPTLVLPLMLVVFIVVRLAFQVPYPIERGLVFPMALVPVLWGVWNMLWAWSRSMTNLSLGAHGAILVGLIIPAGTLIGRWLGIIQLGETSATKFGHFQIPYALVGILFCVAVAAYYLIWKYVVGFVNRTLGVA
ncbi:MAG TPA: hypothetical protein VGL22_07925 [Terracidiphilus sp.]